mmetsp:Transcript_8042/g.24181  ORF Transcript_8042/g.24181 Transcript_8042/m.24181 type:complete len:156 (-) Transcript_8042:2273-2740(-)
MPLSPPDLSLALLRKLEPHIRGGLEESPTMGDATECTVSERFEFEDSLASLERLLGDDRVRNEMPTVRAPPPPGEIPAPTSSVKSITSDDSTTASLTLGALLDSEGCTAGDLTVDAFARLAGALSRPGEEGWPVELSEPREAIGEVRFWRGSSRS